jgi:hypothetical protein
MITITILSVALLSSMVINVIFVWYTRKLINYLEMTNEETKVVFDSIVEYENHLNDVYNRDVFYGDATLEKLLNHTSNLANEVQEYLRVNQELTTIETESENA